MAALAYAPEPDDQPRLELQRAGLLHRRYPTAYGPDDSSGYAVIDKDFLLMYYGTGSAAMSDRQLRLFVALASDPSWPDLMAGQRVGWLVATLAARTGLRCDHVVPALTSAPLGLSTDPESGQPVPGDGTAMLDVDRGLPTRGKMISLRALQDDPARFARWFTTLAAGKRRQSAPVTSELVALLFDRRGRGRVRLVLRRLCARDFDGGTVANLADETLWTDGVVHQQRSLRREIDDPAFRELVTVTRGTPDTIGRKGITTTYDLGPLLEAFGAWRFRL